MRLLLSCTFPRFGGTRLGTYRIGLGLGRGEALLGLKAWLMRLKELGFDEEDDVVVTVE